MSRFLAPRLAVIALVGFLLTMTGLPMCSVAADDQLTRVLVIVGPSTHPPGSHEVAAGGRLMAYCLIHADNLSGIQANVVTGWPDDVAVLDAADTLVFIGDTFPPQRLP